MRSNFVNQKYNKASQREPKTAASLWFFCPLLAALYFLESKHEAI
jgi:hypothetical protein